MVCAEYFLNKWESARILHTKNRFNEKKLPRDTHVVSWHSSFSEADNDEESLLFLLRIV